MKKTVRNLLIFTLLAPISVAAQSDLSSLFFKKNLHQLRQLARPTATHFSFFEKNEVSFFSKKMGLEMAEPIAPFSKKTSLPPAFCAADLAFFCRLELKMDKALRTPVRFRLGSQEYVDWLERKSSARFMDFKN